MIYLYLKLFKSDKWILWRKRITIGDIMSDLDEMRHHIDATDTLIVNSNHYEEFSYNDALSLIKLLNESKTPSIALKAL